MESYLGCGNFCPGPFEAGCEIAGEPASRDRNEEFTWEKAIRRGVEELGLLPSEAWALTPNELHQLYMHQKKADRKHLYHAFLTAWYPNHKEGMDPPSEIAFMPLPGDPGYEAPRKEPTVEECKEMMARNGEAEA